MLYKCTNGIHDRGIYDKKLFIKICINILFKYVIRVLLNIVFNCYKKCIILFIFTKCDLIYDKMVFNFNC